tara:strand:- start:49399 stop:49659 length:261 start_codon:yes stop_codon:yes gene_type:complete
MSLLLPAVCSTFKGVSPSQFAERWGNPNGGHARMMLDSLIAAEINEQINEAHQKSGRKTKDLAGGAKGAVARRNQRRAARRKARGD